jgi:hypothetical protein
MTEVRATVDVPVLLTGCNRPEKTPRMLDAERVAAPQRLLVVADGPRPDHPSVVSGGEV